MGRDHAPVGNTCPTIDDIRAYIEDFRQKFSDDDNDGDFRSALSCLEDVRGANADLREWGNDLHDEKDDIEDERDTLKDRVESLEDEIDDLYEEVKALKKELNSPEITWE